MCLRQLGGWGRLLATGLIQPCELQLNELRLAVLGLPICVLVQNQEGVPWQVIGVVEQAVMAGLVLGYRRR